MHYNRQNESELHKGLLTGMKVIAQRLEQELPNYFELSEGPESQNIRNMIGSLRSNLETLGHLDQKQYEWLSSLNNAWSSPKISQTRQQVIILIKLLVGRSVDVFYEEIKACRNNEWDALEKLSEGGKTLVNVLISNLIQSDKNWDLEMFQTAKCILDALKDHQEHFSDYPFLEAKFETEKRNFKRPSSSSDRIEPDAMNESAELEREEAEKAMLGTSDEDHLAGGSEFEELANKWKKTKTTKRPQKASKQTKAPSSRRSRRLARTSPQQTPQMKRRASRRHQAVSKEKGVLAWLKSLFTSEKSKK